MNTPPQGFAYYKLWPEAIVVYMQGLPTPGVFTDPDGKETAGRRRLAARATAT